MTIDLDQPSEPELIDLNHRIVASFPALPALFLAVAPDQPRCESRGKVPGCEQSAFDLR